MMARRQLIKNKLPQPLPVTGKSLISRRLAAIFLSLENVEKTIYYYWEFYASSLYPRHFLPTQTNLEGFSTIHAYIKQHNGAQMLLTLTIFNLNLI